MHEVSCMQFIFLLLHKVVWQIATLLAELPATLDRFSPVPQVHGWGDHESGGLTSLQELTLLNSPK